jgi:hypothetical protein
VPGRIGTAGKYYGVFTMSFHTPGFSATEPRATTDSKRISANDGRPAAAGEHLAEHQGLPFPRRPQ